MGLRGALIPVVSAFQLRELIQSRNKEVFRTILLMVTFLTRTRGKSLILQQ
jgi:hypothetical protein